MKYRIDIDCPPGDPRPGDLIPSVIKGTGLPLREDAGCRFFGWWTWDYSDIAPDIWKRARPKIRRRLVRLYEQGVIRYAHVSRARGEDDPDSPHKTDAGAPDNSMDPKASDQPRDDDAFVILNLERVATSPSGDVLARVSLVTGTVDPNGR
jgi:hypothetical protein